MSDHLEPAHAATSVTAEHCRTEAAKLEHLQKNISTTNAHQQIIGAVLAFNSHFHEVIAKLAERVFSLENQLTELRITLEDRDVH